MSELEVKIDSELCEIEETLSFIENLSDNEDVSRPDSNVSFSSWTFSPISEEMSQSEDADTQQGEITNPEETSKCQPTLPCQQQMTQPAYQPACAFNYQPVNHIPQMGYPGEHYHHPNAVYHHSVNIHNYNVGPQGWQCEPPKPYTVYNFNVPSVPQPDYVIDQQDPLSTFSATDAEYARCSTPEYIMALNSLKQTDSPPALQTTAKTLQDCSYAPSVPDQPALAPKHIELNKQDSGYSSDLDASPVIDYQDSQARIQKLNQMGKRAMCTSTPAVYPILRLASMINRENCQMVPRRLMPPSVLSMPGFVPKVYAASQPNFVKSTRISQTTNQTSLRQVQSGEVSSSAYHQQNKVKFTSMADFQAAKKRAAQEKRKVEELLDDKENAVIIPDEPITQEVHDSKSSKRRRHNEPLNYVALQVMNSWYEENLDNPYPTKEQKQMLAEKGGITVNQVKSWFANKRNRSNNTRPKKQRKVMEDQLMNICHQLAQDARKPNKDNAYYIQQLSSILDVTKHNLGQ